MHNLNEGPTFPFLYFLLFLDTQTLQNIFLLLKVSQQKKGELYTLYITEEIFKYCDSAAEENFTKAYLNG